MSSVGGETDVTIIAWGRQPCQYCSYLGIANPHPIGTQHQADHPKWP